MKKTLLFGFVFFIGSSVTFSQEVVATSGGHFEGTTATVSWTLGEIMMETYSGTSNDLTQGQQQPLNRPTNTIQTVTNVEMSLYPNPAKEEFTFVSDQKNIRFVMTDSRGQLIKEMTLESEQTSVDIKGIERGVYFINAFNPNGDLLEVFRVVKQ